MISIVNENLIPMNKVGDYCPPRRAGKRVHLTTALRWAQAGCRTVDGERVKLETIRIGASTCTSVEALQRFFNRLSGVQASPLSERPKQEAIERALVKLGY